MKKIVILISILIVLTLITLNWFYYKNSIDISVISNQESIVINKVINLSDILGLSHVIHRENFFSDINQ